MSKRKAKKQKIAADSSVQVSAVQSRGNLDIGNPDALYDEYLENCFVETGVSDGLMDDHSVRSLLVGRTGTGKTACIQRIISQSRSKNLNYVEIQVEREFLGHLKDLDWLRKLANNGNYNLYPLFKNLWKHIIVVCLIKDVFPSQKFFLEGITRFFSKKKNVAARLREYVDSYGGNFWDSEQQAMEKAVQSCTRKIEAKLNMGLGSASYSNETTDAAELAGNSSETDNHLAIQDAIANREMMNALQHAISHISEYIRSEVGRCYYVLIDKLDEEWIDDSIRYSLIRALIEVIRDFYADKSGDGHPIKVVVALRRDLLDSVYKSTRSSGFQSEKYHSFESELQWTSSDLCELIDKRIQYMSTHKSKGAALVKFSDIFPPSVEKKSTVGYMVDRTLQRPRDMINLANCFLKHWNGKQPLTKHLMRCAEREYSEKMFHSIMDEWYGVYPKLSVYAEVFDIKEFREGKVDFSVWRKMMQEIVIGAESEGDAYLDKWIKMVGAEESKTHKVAVEFLEILYCTGLVQIKPNSTSGFMEYPDNISPGQYKKEMLIRMHPMLYGKFGINQSRL